MMSLSIVLATISIAFIGIWLLQRRLRRQISEATGPVSRPTCGAWNGVESSIPAGTPYLRYCRRKSPHPGFRHKDGDVEWGDAEGEVTIKTPEDDDVGQGEGCEGGKCVVCK